MQLWKKFQESPNHSISGYVNIRWRTWSEQYRRLWVLNECGLDAPPEGVKNFVENVHENDAEFEGDEPNL